MTSDQTFLYIDVLDSWSWCTFPVYYCIGLLFLSRTTWKVETCRNLCYPFNYFLKVCQHAISFLFTWNLGVNQNEFLRQWRTRPVWIGGFSKENRRNQETEERKPLSVFGMEELRFPFLWIPIARCRFHGKKRIHSNPLFSFPSWLLEQMSDYKMAAGVIWEHSIMSMDHNDEVEGKKSS